MRACSRSRQLECSKECPHESGPPGLPGVGELYRRTRFVLHVLNGGFLLLKTANTTGSALRRRRMGGVDGTLNMVTLLIAVLVLILLYGL